MRTPVTGADHQQLELGGLDKDGRLRTLRRARTLARLRAAGLSDGTLNSLLPDWSAHVADLARRSSVPIRLTIAD